MNTHRMLPSSPRGLARHIDARGWRRRRALRARLHTLLRTWAVPADEDLATHELLALVGQQLDGADPARIWLALAVIAAAYPEPSQVQRAIRDCHLDGPLAALARTIVVPHLSWSDRPGAWPDVTVVRDRVLVDVHHTARTGLATGIQRVARHTAARWHRDHDVLLVGWNASMSALRELSPGEVATALDGTGQTARASTATGAGRSELGAGVLVPWDCTYVCPELITEPRRSRALLGLLAYSGTSGAMIGFDCVPLTSAETTGEGMGGGYSMMLAAMARCDRVAAISDAAAIEFTGWREMLSGAGLLGPDISAIPLPVEAPPIDEQAVGRARALLAADELPMVLCVGSHEPRKNHLAVLHAAEMLWDEGRRFSIAFVGGNSWWSARFEEQCERLIAAGRPLRSLRSLPDDELWAAYRIARCVVFPSLHEGFGLPVAEALACGTPVVTSDFGSMRELAGAGGAVLVDPRSDDSIISALRQVIGDDGLHAQLRAEAGQVPTRTWDDYAHESWQFLVGGTVISANTAVSASTVVSASAPSYAAGAGAR